MQGVPSLTRLLGSLAAADPISAECQKLLATVKDRCPGVLSPDPLPAGELGPEIPLPPDKAEELYRLVARRVTGLPDPPSDPASPPVPGIIVWTQGDNELAVVVDKISLRPADGVVAVDIPVRCDEVGDATVRVRFAVGSKDRPAGMLATTDERPFGPPLVIDVWGEALTAFAWQTLLQTMTRLADATGRDVDGAGLVPVALAAAPDGLALLTMARHTFDRRTTP
jgi:hypothetical protein